MTTKTLEEALNLRKQAHDQWLLFELHEENRPIATGHLQEFKRLDRLATEAYKKLSHSEVQEFAKRALQFE